MLNILSVRECWRSHSITGGRRRGTGGEKLRWASLEGRFSPASASGRSGARRRCTAGGPGTRRSLAVARGPSLATGDRGRGGQLQSRTRWLVLAIIRAYRLLSPSGPRSGTIGGRCSSSLTSGTPVFHHGREHHITGRGFDLFHPILRSQEATDTFHDRCRSVENFYPRSYGRETRKAAILAVS